MCTVLAKAPAAASFCLPCRVQLELEFLLTEVEPSKVEATEKEFGKVVAGSIVF